jgi:predicted dehydrogenase
MEAMWTRFFPVVLELQRLIHQERILGPIVRVQADFGMPFKFDPKHRLFNPDLGGGALLDLGIYPLTWLMMTVYDDPANKKQMPSLIRSAVLKVRETGVDAHTSATLIFDAIHASATMTTNSEVASHWVAHHTLIQGEKGTITVHGRPYRPESFKVFLKDQDGELGEPQEHNFPIKGQGMHWEADACARCLRDGKTEEQLCSWNDSIATMTILDTIRQQNDFTYPSSIEAVQKQ